MAVRYVLLIFYLILGSQFSLAESNRDDSSAANILNYLFAHKKALMGGIPMDPRTVLKLEERIQNPTKVTLGLDTEILGVVDVGLKTEVEYSRDYSVTSWIFVEGENADIIRQNPGESYFFDPGNRRTVRLCSISASLRLSTSFIGKVFVVAGGVTKSKTYDGIEEVLQTSELVEVKPGESPDVHKRACQDFANRKFKEVSNSLNALAASRIYWDELSQCKPTEEITRDSVCGKWHNSLFPSVIAWTTPTCERRAGQRNYFCNIRSIKGGSCPYRDAKTKKLLTSGMFEYACGKGLECALTKSAGWFNFGKAECRPTQAELSNRLNSASNKKNH